MTFFIILSLAGAFLGVTTETKVACEKPGRVYQVDVDVRGVCKATYGITLDNGLGSFGNNPTTNEFNIFGVTWQEVECFTEPAPPVVKVRGKEGRR